MKKIQQITLFLTALLATSQALNTEIFSAVFTDAVDLELYQEYDFYRGLVLGFQ